MDKNTVDNRGTKSLVITPDQQEQALSVAKALSSSHRLRMLELLLNEDANLSTVAKSLGLPITTAAMHLGELEKAGLIASRVIPAKRGRQRVYSRLYDFVVFHLPQETKSRLGSDRELTFHMPVGAFVNHRVKPTCGLASREGIIGLIDDPVSFYDPERFNAEIVWFAEGYLDYVFPNRSHTDAKPRQLQISMEICSEAPSMKLNWPSDIFMEINGRRLGVWTSPGEFGLDKGVFTPQWWGEGAAQYGLLKVWRVDETGVFVDGIRISDIRISDLDLNSQPFISMRVGVDAYAANVGGLNLFGQGFGNYPQDIVLKVQY